jgi:hypothetical protein
MQKNAVKILGMSTYIIQYISVNISYNLKKKKETPWPKYASELYRPVGEVSVNFLWIQCATWSA